MPPVLTQAYIHVVHARSLIHPHSNTHRLETLSAIKEWYRQARGINKSAVAILVGTKYDVFATFSSDEQAEITRQARRFAKAMKSPLVFSSASHSINIQKMFKVLVLCVPTSESERASERQRDGETKRERQREIP